MCDWCGHGFTQKGSRDKHKREFCRERPGERKTKPPEEVPEQVILEGQTLEEDQGQMDTHEGHEGQGLPVVSQSNGEFDNLMDANSPQYFSTALIFYTE